MAHYLLHVHSRDREAPGQHAPERCSFEMHRGQATRRVTHIGLRSLTVPNHVYNVDTDTSLTYGVRNQMTLEDAGGPVTVTIASGWYTVAELITALNAAWAASPLGVCGAITFAQSAVTRKITATPAVSANFWFVPQSNDPFAPQWLARLAGFDFAQHGALHGATTQTGSRLPNMLPLTHLYFEVEGIESGQQAKNFTGAAFRFKQVLTAIPVSVNFQELITYQTDTPLFFAVDTTLRDMHFLRCQLINDEGDLLANHSADWEATLELISAPEAAHRARLL